MSKNRPDFNYLRGEFSKRIKDPMPKESKCWREFLLANFNFIDQCSFKVTEDEIVNITMSLQNWVDKRNNNQYGKMIVNTYTELPVNIGDIFLADLGLNFEKAYCRPVIIVKEINNYVLVIPTTTEGKVWNEAYHPKTHPEGNKLYRRCIKKNGFDDDCTLLFDNIRAISKGRLLDSHNTLVDSFSGENIYKEIENTLFEKYFYDQFSYCNELITENSLLRDKLKLLESKEMLVSK